MAELESAAELVKQIQDHQRSWNCGDTIPCSTMVELAMKWGEAQRDAGRQEADLEACGRGQHLARRPLGCPCGKMPPMELRDDPFTEAPETCDSYGCGMGQGHAGLCSPTHAPGARCQRCNALLLMTRKHDCHFDKPAPEPGVEHDDEWTTNDDLNAHAAEQRSPLLRALDDRIAVLEARDELDG